LPEVVKVASVFEVDSLSKTFDAFDPLFSNSLVVLPRQVLVNWQFTLLIDFGSLAAKQNTHNKYFPSSKVLICTSKIKGVK